MKPERLGAHVPWARVDEFLQRVLALGLAPEIAFKGPDFDQLDHARLGTVARVLAAEGLRPTVHAPFFDLNPGALDPLIRQASYKRLDQALAAARQLDAHLMVVHPGYDRWRYPGLGSVWATLAADFFQTLLPHAEAADCRLALENIYEQTPETLVCLADSIDSPWFGHCFDAGHWHLFATTPMNDWLEAIVPRLFHLHLHDNQGQADDHLPVGAGHIDFSPLIRKVTSLQPLPSMTLEAHDPADLEQSLAQVKSMPFA